MPGKRTGGEKAPAIISAEDGRTIGTQRRVEDILIVEYIFHTTEE